MNGNSMLPAFLPGVRVRKWALLCTHAHAPLVIGVVLSLLLIVGVLYTESKRFDGLFQFVVLDVGQGSSVYIKTAEGIEILYDTGPEMATLRSLEKFRPWYDRSVDYVIMSHADQDHIGALPDILDAYRVGALVSGPGYRDSELVQIIEKRADKEVITREVWQQGHRVVLDAYTTVAVLHPPSQESESGNDESLVLLVSHGRKPVFTYRRH